MNLNLTVPSAIIIESVDKPPFGATFAKYRTFACEFFPRDALMPQLKVLVVEDHADTAAMLKKMAELTPHEVRVCRTGCQAMELAPKFQPDVILLDIGLPDMSGWDLARACRGTFLLCRARIIAISGNQTDADKLQSKAAGIDVHLGKPVQYSEVLQALGTNSSQPIELLGASD